MGKIQIVEQPEDKFETVITWKLRFSSWIISPLLLTSLFYVFYFKSFYILWWIFLAFILVFVVADVAKYKIKAYVQTGLGLLNLIGGFIIIYVSIFMLESTKEMMLGLLLSATLFYVAYRKFNTFTTLFKKQ